MLTTLHVSELQTQYIIKSNVQQYQIHRQIDSQSKQDKHKGFSIILYVFKFHVPYQFFLLDKINIVIIFKGHIHLFQRTSKKN